MHKARTILYVLAGSIAIGLTTAAAQPTSDRHTWTTYVNVRFQYSICYPKDLLIPQGEAENSDGQRFLSNKGGAELAAYGSNNALDQTLGQRLSEVASSLAGPAGKVTYKVQRANWFVVSGQNGQKIFYAKTFFSHDQFKTFELTYDSSAAALYNPLVERFASCFADLAR